MGGMDMEALMKQMQAGGGMGGAGGMPGGMDFSKMGGGMDDEEDDDVSFWFLFGSYRCSFVVYRCLPLKMQRQAKARQRPQMTSELLSCLLFASC